MTKLLPLLSWRGAIGESDLAPTTRLVALTLSLHMNERGGSAYPGATTLARESGLNVATVRDHLAKLVDLGWLVLKEAGGIRGEKRRANAYEARIPIAVIDPSVSTTGEPDLTDPSSSLDRPVVLDDPISKGTLQEIPPGEEPLNICQELITEYVGLFKSKHRDRRPTEKWIRNAVAAVKEALADGEEPDTIRRCLVAIATENKDPRVLAHVVADYYSQAEAS